MVKVLLRMHDLLSIASKNNPLYQLQRVAVITQFYFRYIDSNNNGASYSDENGILDNLQSDAERL